MDRAPLAPSVSLHRLPDLPFTRLSPACGVASVILPSPPCGEGVACSAPTEPQPFGCLDARRGVGRGAACYALAPPARIINQILCVRTPIALHPPLLPRLPDSPNHQILCVRTPLAPSVSLHRLPDLPLIRLSPARAVRP